MKEGKELKSRILQLDREQLRPYPHRRGPGRGIGEKRIIQERIDELNTLFHNLQQIHRFLSEKGHSIINESGSLLASQSHQNLDQLLTFLEDFLWVLNCAIAKYGGQPKLF
jgi:hypothetical protein